MNLSHWKGATRPAQRVLVGRYARLEPLDPARHGDQLFAAATQFGSEERFRYLFDDPPLDIAAFTASLQRAAASGDPLVFAVIDAATGRAEGRQAFMRITPEHGVIEIGSILWGARIARTRAATEALYLFARHVFDDLGYRRFEWKCDDRNENSKGAAARFGFAFEGVFCQHMVVKGENRDTAWFAMLDRDWPRLKAEYERWLDPGNFDGAGQQRSKLTLQSER